MNVKAFVLHHTASGIGIQGDGSDIVEQLSRMAIAQSQGKFQHFYHLMIGPGGKCFKVLNWNIPAPHCGIDKGDPFPDPSGVNNQNSIALCCIGNFELHAMSEPQFQALLEACKDAKKKFPQAFFKLHRELVATACPGKFFPHARLFENLLNRHSHINDVPSNSWYAAAVQFCLEKGLMSVDEQQRFRPRDAASRAELAQVVHNLMQSLSV